MGTLRDPLSTISLHFLCVDITPLEKTVLSPVPTEAIRYDREIGNPDETTQKTSPRGIEEFLAGELLPLRLVFDIMRFQLRCYTSGEIRIDQIRALRDVDLFMFN